MFCIILAYFSIVCYLTSFQEPKFKCRSSVCCVAQLRTSTTLLILLIGRELENILLVRKIYKMAYT
jgi:hypothetical protein